MLKTILLVFLCTALCLPMWSVSAAAENAPLPEITANSETDEPANGEETPLIPLVPSTPGDTIPPPKKVIQGIYNKFLQIPTVMVAVGDGAAWDDEKNFLEQQYAFIVGVTDEEATEVAELVVESFDAGGFDLETPGDYFVTVTLKIHDDYIEEFALADEARTLQFLISVCAPEKLTLRSAFPTKNAAKMQFFPLRTGGEPVAVWYTSVPRGEPMPQNGWELAEDGFISMTQSGFTINRGQLDQGLDYYFQIETGGKFSNTLKLDPNTLETDYLNNVEGDRDGGDVGGSVPDDDIVQPPPTPDGDGDEPGSGDSGAGDHEDAGSGNGTEGDSGDREDGEPVTPPPTTPPPTTPEGEPDPTPAPEPPAESVPPAASTPPPAPAGERKPTPPPTPPQKPTTPETAPSVAEEPEDFLEVFGETRDLISGTRLRLMLEQTGEAQFSKQGVTVRFSAETVSGLDVQDSDHIAVTVEKEAEDTVFLSFSINDVPVSALPDTRLMVPYRVSAEGARLLLRDEAGETVCEGDYDAALAVVSFWVDTLGRLTITEESPVSQSGAPTTEIPAQTGDGTSLWGLLPAGGVLLLGVWLLLKRRRTKCAR